MRGYALVDLKDGIWPIRTIYTDADDDIPTAALGDDADPQKLNQASSINIGINKVAFAPLMWMSFQDVLASKFLTGKCPIIKKTRRLIPIGQQKGLRTFKFFGDDRYTIDLYSNDLFKRIVEMRSEVKADMKTMEKELTEDIAKKHPDYVLMDTIQLALKLLANASVMVS